MAAQAETVAQAVPVVPAVTAERVRDPVSASKAPAKAVKVAKEVTAAVVVAAVAVPVMASIAPAWARPPIAPVATTRSPVDQAEAEVLAGSPWLRQVASGPAASWEIAASVPDQNLSIARSLSHPPSAFIRHA